MVNTGGYQWRNRRGGGAGGRVPPRDFWPGNFCWPIGEKKRGREKMEKGETEKKRRKIVKGKVENWEWKEGLVSKWGEDLFFFLSFFAFTFQNDKNLFWVYQNGNFLPEKAFHAGKKIRKNDFAPSEKFSCYAPGGYQRYNRFLL